MIECIALMTMIIVHHQDSIWHVNVISVSKESQFSISFFSNYIIKDVCSKYDG
jgi:hypothetical protein